MTDALELKQHAAVFGCDISKAKAERLLAYLDAMLEENRHINLTAVRDREAAILFHALDSLAVGASVFDLKVKSCLDLGSGNGFPGVAVACLFPEAQVLLMDRTLKKVKAIERALAAAGFDAERVRSVQMDAADAPSRAHRWSYDLVTARAVGPPREIGRLALPLLAEGGSLFCWLSDDPAASSAQLKGLRRQGKLDYELPPPADRRRKLVRFGR